MAKAVREVMSRSVERRLAVQARGGLMLEQLKRFDAERTSVEEMVSLISYAKVLRQGFEGFNLPVPEWLDDRLRQLTRAIDAQTRDAKELRLKEIRAAQTQLLTAGEKREKLAQEEAALVSELAQK